MSYGMQYVCKLLKKPSTLKPTIYKTAIKCMDTPHDDLAKYLVLIKKITNWKISDSKHQELKEDVAQEVFLKLFKQGYFAKNNIEDSEQIKLIASYINRTVQSCYIDYLQSSGITRRLTSSEREQTGARYQNIEFDEIVDTDESDNDLLIADSPEQYRYAKEAYDWIKSCFDELIKHIKDVNRCRFFESAFWQAEQIDIPMKMLASQLGYASSNPTQEFKRFIQKVSLCTQPHGITINAPNEQVQFLKEQIIASEGEK